DVRENRRLRTNERLKSPHNGGEIERAAPMRIDGHYLITAWSPAMEGPSPQTVPTLDEHEILYEVAAVLVAHQPLVPRAVYDGLPVPKEFPDEFTDAELPSTLLPAEGFATYAEC